MNSLKELGEIKIIKDIISNYTDIKELNEDAVGAKVVSQLSPTISKAVDAAVAENVASSSVDQSAIAAAGAAAVAEALSVKK